MKFDSSHLGPQALNAEDRQSAGSRYAEVRSAMFENPYYLCWGEPGTPPLPVYDVTLRNMLRRILPGGRPWLFKQSAERTLVSAADLRWGPDRRGYRRFLHPNGLALFGRWIIDHQTPYTGYFRFGSEGLVIGRYSTCCREVRRGYYRSLSLVGKIYPTANPDHQELLRPANFITQEDLGGNKTMYINDAFLRNAPDTSPWRRQSGLPILLLTGLAFLRVDREPSIRQLYPIAELGKWASEKTNCPQFMQLVMESDRRESGDELDFRDEVMGHIYDHGNSIGQRKLVFHIEVTDDGKTKGKLVQRRTFGEWKRIGRIEFDEAVVSYNADFVLHFRHPPWRLNRNDSNSEFRQQHLLKSH